VGLANQTEFGPGVGGGTGSHPMSQAKAAILRPRELRTNDRGNGARTTPPVTRKCGSTSMINGRPAFDPGVAVGLHKHNCEERS
jgi:hypothetical protein